MQAKLIDIKLLPDKLTPEQAAGFLQVSLSTIYNWIREGELPAEKLGNTRTIRIDKSKMLAAFQPVTEVEAQ